MKNLPLNAIRAFAAVYETGGIRPAARLLEITHSSISKHVQELEAWIGVSLIDREQGVRTIKFTPQGEDIGRVALENLNDMASAVEAVRESKQGNAVTISTTPSFAARWLLPRLQDFNATFPWIELSIVVDQKLNFAADHGADLAIRMGQGPWDGLECTPLMDEQLFPVMSTSLWLKVGRPTELSALEELPLLHDRDPQASWQRWLSEQDSLDFDTRSGPRFASSDLVLRAAVQGLGVALARGRLVEDDLATGLLIKPFEGKEAMLAQAYWLLHPKGKKKSIAIAKVIEWLSMMSEQELHGS
ncbi:LysR family transcriptional regulator [Kiloniella spongiae]|uniref:LysR family transcriptional regulator n=1 Tax=Kiloniella spongiae TaxID=1489064 RepID=A0A0H2M903_9PROT|nr:LysR substrate-binding domain-containing protein [Kiloniella spongiae]KLN58974.1 LysR family transcriptional regulator [Kiloniella spongiae]